MDEDNDGRFPDNSRVLVRYPRNEQEERGDRRGWPWLPGSILSGLACKFAGCRDQAAMAWGCQRPTPS